MSVEKKKTFQTVSDLDAVGRLTGDHEIAYF
jgi:hypothetical protein